MLRFTSTRVARGWHKTKTSASSSRSLTFCVSVALSLFSGGGGNQDGTSDAQAVAALMQQIDINAWINKGRGFVYSHTLYVNFPQRCEKAFASFLIS